jgi:predicted NACHT family NTPase
MSEDLQKPKEQDLLEKIKKFFEEKALSLGLPGTVLALAFHFAREQKWSVVIALVAAAGLIALLLRFFSKLTPHLDKLFEWLASNFAGWVQRSWWKMTAQFQGRYYARLIYACRDFRTQGLKTKGPFTLDFEKVFVPLRVAPESADLATAGMLQGRGTTDGLMIWDFLAQLKNQPAFRRIVVIAPPGAGKSTLLEHLALTYAKNTQRRRNRTAPRLIPILLYLRDVRVQISGEHPPELATLIEQQESIQTLNPKGWFKGNLDRGKCLVMLDGLDEVADEGQRQKVSRWVDRQMEVYPKTPFMLTSRPFGYRSAPLNQVGTVLEVKPFSLREMRQFVNNWYLQNELMSRLGKDDPGVREKAKQQAEDLIKRIQDTPTL